MSIGSRSPFSVTAVAPARAPCVTCASSAVVGVMPVGRSGVPSSALMNVDLP